ncbi:hypothetical protein ACIQ9K_39055 [Streptomyces microflavus]|uniref:hypothetical protein n=1 Tax=Streptomyces microflavus TaxID=1919 RepID=UPI00381F5DBE
MTVPQLWKIQPQRSAETALLHRISCGFYKFEALIGYVEHRTLRTGLAPCEVRAPAA